jgi:RNA recognition motif-containing protein
MVPAKSNFQPGPEEQQMKNIYVGNLNFNTSEDEIRSLFEGYGQVDNVSMIRDRDTGQPRGFAFVEMPNDNEADAAIQGLNGRELAGRNLNINEARPRAERSGGGGGGGRGGFGRGAGGGGGRGGFGGGRGRGRGY